MQVLEWDNMLATLDPEHPENACFHCVECGRTIEEHHRPKMLARIEARASNPKAKREHRSFWIWSAYSLLQSFERIAREWLKAKGDPAAEQTFLNDTCGLAYRAQGEAPPWEALRDRGAESHYVKGVIPTGGLLLTIGLDCQGDRIEWQLVAFGREGRRYVVDYNVIPGHISDKECQGRLDDLLKQTWPNSAGRRIAIDMAAIDGNAYTEDVWEWAKRHPASRVIMVRGVAPDSAPLLQRVKKEFNRRTGKVLKYSSRFYNFGASVLKMALYRNALKGDPLDQGHVAFPKGLEDEYYRQMTAERRTPFKRHGFTEYRWTKDPAQANEGLDTMLQAEAAAIKWGVRGLPDATWDALEAERESPLKEAQSDLEDLMRSIPKPVLAQQQTKSASADALASIARMATRGR
jgi:phage terminase large subunit GpA-like protein